MYNFLEFNILKEIIIFIELYIFNLFHGREKNDHVRKISISYSFNFVYFLLPYLLLFFFILLSFHYFFLFNIFHLYFSFLFFYLYSSFFFFFIFFFYFVFIFHILKEKFGSIKIRLFVLGNCEKFFFAIIIFWNVLLTELFWLDMLNCQDQR